MEKTPYSTPASDASQPPMSSHDATPALPSSAPDGSRSTLSPDYAMWHAIVNELLDQLTRVRDPDVIIQQAVQTIVRLHRWYSVGISMPTPDGQHWQTRAADRLGPGEIGALYPINAGIVGRAYRTGAIQFVPDVTVDPDFFSCLADTGSGSELVVPITFDGNVLGAINLESDQRTAFNQDDIALAQQIAHILAIALTNARRLATLQQEIMERTQSESRFFTIFQHSPIAISLLRLRDYTVVDVNAAALELFGYAREETIGHATLDLNLWVLPEDRQQALEQFRTRGAIRAFETTIRQKSGNQRKVLLWVDLININGEGHLLNQIIDIHDLKVTQQQLQELNATLEERVAQRTAEVQDLYENAPTGYHSLDAHGHIIRMNQTLLRWLGYSREEVLGRPVTAFVSASSRTVFQKSYPMLKQRGWVRDVPIELIRKDGAILPVLISATAMYDEAGTFVMSRSTVFDNSERKQVEDALQLANTQLERALRTKDEFLASMSHELRTPLNAILAISEILREETFGSLNPRQQNFIAQVETSGLHLLTLINDILDLAKVEAGQLDLQRELVPLAEICRVSLQFINAIAIKKRLRLRMQLQNESAEIEADPRRLKQMLVNLLANAVKFTPEGGTVSLEVQVDPEESVVLFRIRDSGIGIAEEDLERLFQPFTQLDAGLNRQYEGSGLGLALVRQLAKLHGGSVSVESKLGAGSCFTIVLPYRSPQPICASTSLPAQEKVRMPPSPLSKDTRILLVEDNEDTIEVMYDYLQAKQYEVLVARTGREAIEQATASKPDMILMDIQMPEMDGLEAIRHLRSRPENAKTAIIALTALAMKGDRERCLAAGANEYLTKPVSLKLLVETIERLLRSE